MKWYIHCNTVDALKVEEEMGCFRVNLCVAVTDFVTFFTELYNPSDPSKPKMGDVYSVLVDSIYFRWFDIFLNLGIDRAMLEKSAKDHPYNSHLSLLDVIILWLEREDPPPTWQALADVLRHKLLEGKIADEIEKKYCAKPSSDQSKCFCVPHFCISIQLQVSCFYLRPLPLLGTSLSKYPNRGMHCTYACLCLLPCLDKPLTAIFLINAFKYLMMVEQPCVLYFSLAREWKALAIL